MGSGEGRRGGGLGVGLTTVRMGGELRVADNLDLDRYLSRLSILMARSINLFNEAGAFLQAS